MARLQTMQINVYVAYFEPRINRAVNACPLRFDIMKFCCTCRGRTKLLMRSQLNSFGRPDAASKWSISSSQWKANHV